MAKIGRIKPEDPKPAHLTVTGRSEVSPSFTRVELGGEDLHRYQLMGFDQWFRTFLPGPEGQDPRVLEDMGLRSVATYLLTPASRRPLIRNYTTLDLVPAPDGGTPTLLVDVYTDPGHSGPGAQWAVTAPIGSPVAILDEGRLHNPPADTTWELLVGDESALPAIAGILRDSPAGRGGHAIIEIGDEADRRGLEGSTDIEVTWARRGPDDAPGDAALRALEALDPIAAPGGYAYLAGEQSLVQRARRHVVSGWQLGKDRITFTGYWRRGRGEGQG